jgi:hypothetical protein
MQLLNFCLKFCKNNNFLVKFNCSLTIFVPSCGLPYNLLLTFVIGLAKLSIFKTIYLVGLPIFLNIVGLYYQNR